MTGVQIFLFHFFPTFGPHSHYIMARQLRMEVVLAGVGSCKQRSQEAPINFHSTLTPSLFSPLSPSLM